MATIEINKDTLLKEYGKASKAGKDLLIKLHGKEVFEKKITDRVKTFEDACTILKLSPAGIFSKTDTKDEVAYKKLKVIIRALNEGWTPNWKNSDEYKYYPWFDLSDGGFVLDYVSFSCSGSFVGSRLCFVSREVAEYAAKQFLSIYKDLFIA